jgi:hypothetical protein
MNSPIKPLKQYLTKHHTDILTDPKKTISIVYSTHTDSIEIKHNSEITRITKDTYPRLYDKMDSLRQFSTNIPFPNSVDEYTIKFNEKDVRIQFNIYVPTNLNVSFLTLTQITSPESLDSFELFQEYPTDPLLFRNRDSTQTIPNKIYPYHTTLCQTFKQFAKACLKPETPNDITENIIKFSFTYFSSEEEFNLQLSTQVQYKNCHDLSLTNDSYFTQFQTN